MRVHHLHCGSGCPPTHRFVPELAPTNVIHCLLVESGNGLVLVDTGLGYETARNPKGRLGDVTAYAVGMPACEGQSAIERVRALGFDPRDVRDVVITHLDFDHAGGIADFPEARIHVWQSELAAALKPQTLMARLRYRPYTLQGHERWQTHHELSGESWFGFDYARPLAGSDDEILLVPLPGHTHGHCGVAIRSADGWILHAGDAYYSRRELDSPARSLGFNLLIKGVHTIWDMVLANQARLAALIQARPDLRVICAHDPDELAACHPSQGQTTSSPATPAPIAPGQPPR